MPLSDVSRSPASAENEYVVVLRVELREAVSVLRLSLVCDVFSLLINFRSFDQRAKDATAQFEDFSLQLLERIFSFLAQKSAPEKKPAYAARLAASLLPVRTP